MSSLYMLGVGPCREREHKSVKLYRTLFRILRSPKTITNYSNISNYTPLGPFLWIKLLLINSETREETRASLRHEFFVTPTGETKPQLVLF